MNDFGASTRNTYTRKLKSAASWVYDANASSPRRILVVVCLASILLNLVVVTNYVFGRRIEEPDPIPIGSGSYGSSISPGDLAAFQKPTDFRIVGLVFAGRRDRLSILNCYLQRNLASNGGFLDEVVFILHTDIPEDISYLRRLTSSDPLYTLVEMDLPRHGSWSKPWSICQPGTMYIKIDDDVLFIEDSTIPGIVRTKLKQPDTLIVSANLFNQALMSWVHHHLGVVRPYLPELKPIQLPYPKPRRDWRASALPAWEGPADYEVPKDHFEPPFQQHRWLPVPHLNTTDQTPIATTEYRPGTAGVMHWTVAAQQHYSFLEHLEKDDLWRYRFNSWDYMYTRLSINLIAIWGNDIVDHLKLMEQWAEDDEEFLTVHLPKLLGRHVIVDGAGVAAHFSFKTQKELDSTDLLSRYKAYAEERICKGHMVE